MRPDEPVWLKEWRIIAASVPKCEKFDMYPPEEFADTKNACEEWEIECGF